MAHDASIAFRASSIALAWFCLVGCDKKSATPKPEPAPATPDAAATTKAPQTPLELGRKVYETKGCASCHTIDGTKKVGAPLDGVWGTTITLFDGSPVVVDEAFLRRALDEPQTNGQQGYPPSMPSYKGMLSDEELAGLAAFMASLP